MGWNETSRERRAERIEERFADIEPERPMKTLALQEERPGAEEMPEDDPDVRDAWLAWQNRLSRAMDALDNEYV